MMSIEILECDPTVWSDQSFFKADDYQTQHSCGITSKLGSDETEWSEEMKEFWDSLELNFNNEPDFALEVMNTEVESQTYVSKIDELNYNEWNSSASVSSSLSPLSTAPSSPAQDSDDNFEHPFETSNLSYMTDNSLEEDLDNTSAMAILNEILSANSTDNEESQESSQYPINAIEYYTQVANESTVSESSPQKSDHIESDSKSNERNGIKQKQQLKRKTPSNVDLESSQTKRSKRSNAVLTDKKERKKDQNKSAANRYRLKKRAEQESIDVVMTEEKKRNEELKAQLEKIQMEFKVVYPLAKAAFATNHHKNALLRMLDLRITKDNLLD